MRTHTIQDLIHYLERGLLEKSHYFVIRTLYSNEIFELMYKKQNDGVWQIRPKIYGNNDGEWLNIDKANLFNYLSGKLHIDLVDFEIQLLDKILTMAAYTHMISAEIEKLVGREMIEEAIAAQEEFQKNLLAMINQLLPGSSQSNDNRNDQAPDNSKKAPHLSIIS
jgi:hypothetical protein